MQIAMQIGSSVTDIRTYRGPRHPSIRWSAIAAGLVVGLAVQLLFALFGAAAGLSVLDLISDTAAQTLPAWAGLWHASATLMATFVGAYVATRLSGLRRSSDGVLQGCVTWAALCLLLSLVVVGSAGILSRSALESAQAAAVVYRADLLAQAPMVDRLEALVLGNAVLSPAIQLTAERLTPLAERVELGDRDGAIRYLGDVFKVGHEAATTIVDQAIILSGTVPKRPPDARLRVAQVVRTTALASWCLLASAALSLLTGIGGGVAGARAARRQTLSPLWMQARPAA